MGPDQPREPLIPRPHPPPYRNKNPTMASDDLIRIVYRPKRMKEQDAAPAHAAKGTVRRNRTSISMDPDLYETFVLIEGDARAARAKLRQWATEADSLRSGRTELTGVSRLVHKQMLAKIREVVEAGLTVIQVRGKPTTSAAAGKAAAAEGDDVGAAWDALAAPSGDRADQQAAKAIKRASKSAKQPPAKKGNMQAEGTAGGDAQFAAATGTGDAPESAGGTPARPGHGLAGLQPVEADLPLAPGAVNADTTEWTRVRDEDAHADPFMG